MSQPTLRRAQAADAEPLVELGRATFTATFDHYPASDLQPFLDGAHTPGLYLDWIADPAHAVWIVEQHGAAVGYAVAGPCGLPHPEVTASCGELKRIYLRAAAQGSGLGALLIDTALGWLERPGRRLWIGVWSQNHRAQRLYASRGFKKVGEYQFPVGETRDREFILMREADL